MTLNIEFIRIKRREKANAYASKQLSPEKKALSSVTSDLPFLFLLDSNSFLYKLV